jgi:hypothetical protein
MANYNIKRLPLAQKTSASQNTVYSLWRDAHERGKICLKHSQRYHEEYFSQQNGLI